MEQSWQCRKCGESGEDTFEVCWNCGTSRDGTIDPKVRSADNVVNLPRANRSDEHHTGTTLMFACPHCQKTIEVGPREQVPWYHYDPGNPKVGLGCGTLLAIAVIVTLCSGGISTRNEVESLQHSVRQLSNEVGEVRKSIDRLAPPTAVTEPLAR